jgi:hypothetical protein
VTRHLTHSDVTVLCDTEQLGTIHPAMGMLGAKLQAPVPHNLCHGYEAEWSHAPQRIAHTLLTAKGGRLPPTCPPTQVLYFDPRSGRQIKENQRDTQ